MTRGTRTAPCPYCSAPLPFGTYYCRHCNRNLPDRVETVKASDVAAPPPIVVTRPKPRQPFRVSSGVRLYCSLIPAAIGVPLGYLNPEWAPPGWFMTSLGLCFMFRGGSRVLRFAGALALPFVLLIPPLNQLSVRQAERNGRDRPEVSASGGTSSELSRRPGYVSRAEFGAQWPLTVDEGVLICANNAVLFETGGRRYAVNGTAKRQGVPPIDPIWRSAPPLFGVTPLERIPEPERRRAFRSLVECQDRGSSTEHDTECYTKSATKHRLAAKEMRQISTEGVSLGWPPLRPTRVNIGPLIDRGLALCRR